MTSTQTQIDLPKRLAARPDGAFDPPTQKNGRNPNSGVTAPGRVLLHTSFLDVIGRSQPLSLIELLFCAGRTKQSRSGSLVGGT
jgi:hypothetical protein